MAKRGKKRAYGYKHKITAQALDKSVVEFDPDPAAWRNVVVFRCSIEPVRLGETVDGQQVVGRTSHVIRCRWTPGTKRITTDMRFRLEDDEVPEADRRIFHIDAIVNLLERNTRLVFFVEERTLATVASVPPVPWEWMDDTIHTWDITGEPDAFFFG